MFNFIPVSFCFLLILGFRLGSVIGLGFGIGTWNIFDRWRCRHSGHPRLLDTCNEIVLWYTLASVGWYHHTTLGVNFLSRTDKYSWEALSVFRPHFSSNPISTNPNLCLSLTLTLTLLTLTLTLILTISKAKWNVGKSRSLYAHQTLNNKISALI